ncbi:MAG: hypothetical protein UV48_C0017G0022 [Candidatus Azambacteria bacterium GW2011_GWA2_42_9]|uniref:Uncharacterized protein n=3 Tax=Candidatus Azamiibacteriota TaxID=1752741 RepID=A0A0G1BHJ6_9BACT|nr:MAG: hypothetical protein UV07_C0006G0019 [Candidatus Azambacteria bacterium GW2011_GWB1_42_17]KKS45771.1 MAG: hypothetical protein UV10_C0014G0011 [Candidatus Azambacteria bacterium GW2011_GWA1_42_19]KKS75180.1 MAG: hypothetical protein UV48_C0017G0022 [Candidatus Azambacteria bacterium GW2011_GWA2_42_9]KKS88189.1 MAG: hypothetical protein UV62_C0012G0020 [Parcubacteria group bacterium GW2011_GWC1_43_11]
MKFQFVFGFILLILVLIGIFVGLPYLLGVIKSNQFFNFSFPKYVPTPTSPTPANAPISTSVGVSMSFYRYGGGQIDLKAPYFSGASVNITGWKIKSEKKGETIIGKGYALPQVDAALSDILLSSGESAKIIVGKGPLAGNFRINNCFGWLGSVYGIDYSMNYCPRVELGDLTGLDSACQDLILSVSSCRIPSEDVLNRQSNQCRIWVEKNLNYNTCVNNRRQDSDFFKGWQIYTGNDNPIFDSLHDNVKLYDKSGILIDSYEY